jgi:hypothetical protein
MMLDGSLFTNRARHEQERRVGAPPLRLVVSLVAGKPGLGLVREELGRRVLVGALEILPAFGSDDGAIDSLLAQGPRNKFPITFIVFKVDQPHPHLFDAHEVTYRRGIRQSL